MTFPEIRKWLFAHDSFGHALIAIGMCAVLFLISSNLALATVGPVLYFWGREVAHDELNRDIVGTANPLWKRMVPLFWYIDSQRDLLYPAIAMAIVAGGLKYSGF
jgi:hypothetical protein